ncbi:MAG: LysM peptidoglycan-binding domain-containing protein [bacterium]
MFRLFLIGVLGCLMLCGPGCFKPGPAVAESAERGSALYRQAFSAEQSGDIKEAIRLFNKVLIEEPRSYSAHFQLATLLHDHEEDFIGAIYHYKQYLYLRPESEKSTLVQDRIRIAEQLLAPQILRKVGDSAQGISQAHLLKENERLNRVITTMEGEKAVLMEGKAATDKELVDLRDDLARLREVLNKMRVSETVSEPAQPILKRVEAAIKTGEGDKPAPKLNAKSVSALRDEASSVAEKGKPEAGRKPLVEVPTTDAMIKKVQARLEGVPAAQAETAKPEVSDKSGQSGRSSLSALSLFGREEKREKGAKSGGEQRTYVVQPGDTLFRVAEKFYGDSTKWKRIRDANRSRIDPDGRIRAGQIITVP